jgi:hypothetical protein
MSSNNPVRVPFVEPDAIGIVNVESTDPVRPEFFDRFRTGLSARRRRVFRNGFLIAVILRKTSMDSKTSLEATMKIDEVATLRLPYDVCHISDNPLAGDILRRAGPQGRRVLPIAACVTPAHYLH